MERLTDPEVWIPLLIAAIGLIALAVGSWWEERERIKRASPDSYVDWWDD